MFPSPALNRMALLGLSNTLLNCMVLSLGGLPDMVSFSKFNNLNNCIPMFSGFLLIGFWRGLINQQLTRVGTILLCYICERVDF